jgi:hypothetical protein
MSVANTIIKVHIILWNKAEESNAMNSSFIIHDDESYMKFLNKRSKMHRYVA